MNAALRYRRTDGVTALVQAQNLLDARFYTFGVVADAAPLVDAAGRRFYSPGGPRAVWARLDLRF